MRHRREKRIQNHDSATSTTAAAATSTRPQGCGTTKMARKTAATKSNAYAASAKTIVTPLLTSPMGRVYDLVSFWETSWLDRGRWKLEVFLRVSRRERRTHAPRNPPSLSL
jgi:hypothetical protein